MDSKSTKCVFLGISEESNAYRLYNPITKKVIVSRDVVFSDIEKWNWKNDKSNQKGNEICVEDTCETSNTKESEEQWYLDEGEQAVTTEVEENSEAEGEDTTVNTDLNNSNPNLAQGMVRREAKPPSW